MASRPDPINAISPNHNQALASALGAPPETVTICEFTISPAKSVEVYGKARWQTG